MNKNRYEFIFLAVSVISVFLILLFSSLFSYIYNLNYYDSEYQKYNIYDRFSKDTALNATKNLMGFFKSRNELDNNFFNAGEISHLADVKHLIKNVSLLYYASLILFWGILVYYYFFHKKHFTSFFFRMMILSGLFTLSVFLIFGLLYVTSGFDFIFLKFHQIFFTGNYSFNPNVSNMKAIFPDEFFFDIAFSIFLVTMLKASLISCFGYYYHRKHR